MTRRFNMLDLLRGVTATLVLLDHTFSPVVEGRFLTHAFLSVDFFMILGGFIVAKVNDARLHTSLSPDQFMKSRLIRLYPVVTLGFVLGCVGLIVNQTQMPGWAILLQFMLIPVIINPTAIFPLNPPIWSLFFTVIANAGYAYYLRRFHTFGLMALCALAGLLLFAIAWYFRTLNIGFRPIDAPGGLVRMVWSYCVGLVFYRLWATGRLPRFSVPWWTLPIALVALFCIPSPFGLIRSLASELIILPVFMLLAINADTPKWIEGFSRWFGGISFALYVIHQPIVTALHGFLEPLPMSVKVAWWAAVCLGCMGLADIVNRFYDAPIQRALKGWRAKRASTVS